MYFNKLGTTEYNGITIPDIFKRIIITAEAQNSNLFEKYEIIEGETPESLSYNYYGVVDYYWLIMIVNSIKSRYFSWPLSSQEIGQYVESLYGNKSALFFTESQLNDIVLCETKFISFNNQTKKVVDCDRNLNKLIIEKVTDQQIQSHTQVSLLNQNNVILKTVVPSRTVYENEYAVHHFEGIETQPRLLLNQYVTGESNTSVVSNYDHEINLNEQKRSIVLVRPPFISTLVNEYKKLALA